MDAKVFIVPGEIAAAITTDRPEFAAGLARQVEEGSRTLTRKEQAGLCDTIASLVKERGVARERLGEAGTRIDQLVHATEGLASLAGRIQSRLRGEPIADNDDG